MVGLIGKEFGTALQAAGGWDTNAVAVQADGTTVEDDVVSEAAGTTQPLSDSFDSGLSSLLVGEAAQALGLNGFAGVVFTSVGTTITTQLVKNLGNIALDPSSGLGEISASQLFNGFEDLSSFATNLEKRHRWLDRRLPRLSVGSGDKPGWRYRWRDRLDRWRMARNPNPHPIPWHLRGVVPRRSFRQPDW